MKFEVFKRAENIYFQKLMSGGQIFRYDLNFEEVWTLNSISKRIRVAYIRHVLQILSLF